MFLFYLALRRPFTGGRENAQQIFFEILLLLDYLCTMIIAIEDLPSELSDMSDTLSTIIFVTILTYNGLAVLVTTITFIIVIQDAIKSCKARSQNKNNQRQRKKIGLEALKLDIKNVEESKNIGQRKSTVLKVSKSVAKIAEGHPRNLEQRKSTRFKVLKSDLRSFGGRSINTGKSTYKS